MNDQDELRDRIARVLFDRDQITLERRGYFKMRWEESDAKYLKPWREEAQAIIDEFGMTAHGDDCGYHEIHGSYDTRFEDWETQ